MNTTLLIGFIRAIAGIAPVVAGKDGEEIAKVINIGATLAERGAEGEAELEAFKARMETMATDGNGISREIWDELLADVDAKHNRLQGLRQQIGELG